ncbi:hypothetical protein [Methylomicrobium sp. Wu6]|uniref:hypothetical protein n=1 Tax=Methylomicrobium sp. Wu6 TaxID=3107928 RepID=UPI002DD63762|nr:hypothetical protein [Methylomicrobium sp. Wu6]MEC4747141.1 hypothetical protein [Methylomicrobium sp. Wu6]
MKRKNRHGQKTGSSFEIPLGLLLSIFHVLALALVLQQSAFAHRGNEDENDPCRIQVGSEWIHFAAYTPIFTEGKSYCRSIPKVGMTNLVFDYEGKQLRHISIEFEVTKEPEGTRIFYRPPNPSKSGTVDGSVDFSRFGAGNYQVHVTLVENDKKVDTHIPFSVGVEGDESYIGVKRALFTFLICAAIIYLCIRFARGKGDDPKMPEVTK